MSSPKSSLPQTGFEGDVNSPKIFFLTGLAAYLCSS